MPTRRHVIECAAYAAGASLVTTGVIDLARAQAKGKTHGETKHFHYRLAPDGPYIDAQRGSLAFGFDRDNIYLSQDCAKSWPNKLAFKGAGRITFSVILKSGAVLFATRTRLFRSDDKLKTINQVTVKNPDGSAYKPHTPINPKLPGWYFHPLDGVHTWETVGGHEMLAWGNYCNVLGGAVPVNIYYSADQGKTVKLAYAFGVSPRWQQRGAGKHQLLGDPKNPVIARHIHSVAYNPAEDAYYACTGDHDEKRNGKRTHECHWLRGTYDREKDKWAWRVVVSASQNSRYKSGGINFVNGKLYWTSDANGPKPHDRGIFRCDPRDLADKTKHERLLHPTYEVANMVIEDSVMLSGHYTPVSPYNVGIIYSPDLGKSWAQYDLKGMGRWSPVRMQKKNSDGWFRVDLRERWIKRGKVMFIKPKKS